MKKLILWLPIPLIGMVLSWIYANDFYLDWQEELGICVYHSVILVGSVALLVH